MANARTRFDTICDYLNRVHETSSGSVYGKPCVMFHGRAFIAFHMDGMGFKMRGRIRLQALALPNVRFWDPLLPDRPDPDWVWVPSVHVLRWDRLAVEAYRQQKEQGDSNIMRVRPSASPPLVPRPVAAPAAARPVTSPALANATLGEVAITDINARVEVSAGAPRPEPPPPPATTRLPNWAERLKSLTGWMKWTTSGRDSP